MQSISADLVGKTWEATHATSIGLVSVSLVVCLLVVFVMLDFMKLLTDLRMLRRNLCDASDELRDIRESLLPVRRDRVNASDREPSVATADKTTPPQ